MGKNNFVLRKGNAATFRPDRVYFWQIHEEGEVVFSSDNLIDITIELLNLINNDGLDSTCFYYLSDDNTHEIINF